jgi:hypothetical protein
MSQQQLFRFVTDLVPCWRKTRRRVLALGVGALLARRRLTLTGLARGLESATRIRYRVKRLWRFIDNAAIDPRELSCALASQACRRHGRGWLPLIMDETGIGDRFMVLGAAVAHAGRALPLALYAYWPPTVKKSLWALREGLLSVVLESLPAADRARVLLIGDRGYAASHFFRRLLNCNIGFVIRVPRKVLIHMGCQHHNLEFLAADLQPGERRFLRRISYGPVRARLNLALWWDYGQPEPWLLATTLDDAAQAVRYYRMRMGIEEMFKDFKGRFALEACAVKTRDRATRICMFLTLALWVLALLVRYPNTWQQWIVSRGPLSFVTLALEWLDAPPSIRRMLRAEAQSG